MHIPGPAQPGPFASAGPEVISISAAADGTVWALDASGRLLQNTEGAVAWSPRPGRLADIGAASDGTVYAIGADGSFLSYTGAWRQLKPPPGALLASVAVGSSALVWATDRDGQAYRYDPAAQLWTTMPVPRSGQVQALGAASDGTVCGLSDGAVFRFADGSWNPVPEAPALRALGVGAAGWLWGIDAAGTISQYDGDDRPWAPAPPLAGGGAARISCGDDGSVWVADKAGGLHQLDARTQSWVPVPDPAPGATVRISVGSAPSAWAIQSDGSAYQYVKDVSSWSPAGLDLVLRQITARDQAAIWGTDTSGGLYALTRRDGTWTPAAQPAKLGWVSVSPDGTLLGAGPGGDLVRFDPGTSTWPSAGRPAGDGPVVQVAAAGPKLALVLCATGNLHRWDGSAFQPAGKGLPAGVSGMSMLPGGTAYAAGTDHRLYLFLDKWLPAGDGPLVQVSASALDRVWGISLGGHAVEISSGTGAGSGTALPRWDTESVFDEAQSTHLWIVNRAALLASQYGALGAALAGLVKPGRGRLDDPFHDNLCQGLRDADYIAPYNDPVHGQPTYKSHFYDPKSGENYDGDTSPTALTRGRSLFGGSLQLFRERDVARAGYFLGLALHYFTDVTQPMHAANFTWLDSHPRFGYHTDFERYAMEIQSTILPPARFTPSSIGTDPAAHIIAAASQSKARLSSIWPDKVSYSYTGMTGSLRQTISGALPTIMKETILATARYLIAWMTEASSDWTDCGGTVAAGAGACLLKGEPWAFVIKPDGRLAVNYPQGTSRVWSDRGTPPGTQIAAAMGAAVYADQIYAYVCGANGHLGLNVTGVSGGTWHDLGVPVGAATEDGGAAEDGAAAPGAPLEVRMGLGVTATSKSPVAYVLASSGDVYYHTTMPHSKWTNIGRPSSVAPVSTALGAAVFSPDHPYTAVITDDGRLHVHGLGSGDKTQWMDVGTPSGVRIAAPVGICGSEIGVHAAVLGSDGNLWHASSAGRFWTWENRFKPGGQQLTTGMGLVAAGNSTIYYLVTGATGDLWVAWRASLNVPTWSTAGSPAAGISITAPVGSTGGQTTPYGFFIGSDTHLWEFSGTGDQVP
jgi:hypothetical protein